MRFLFFIFFIFIIFLKLILRFYVYFYIKNYFFLNKIFSTPFKEFIQQIKNQQNALKYCQLTFLQDMHAQFVEYEVAWIELRRHSWMYDVSHMLFKLIWCNSAFIKYIYTHRDWAIIGPEYIMYKILKIRIWPSKILPNPPWPNENFPWPQHNSWPCNEINLAQTLQQIFKI